MGTHSILGLIVCLLLVLVVIFPRRQQFGASEMLLVVCSKHFSKLYLSCYNPVVLCFVLSLCLFCCVLIGIVKSSWVLGRMKAKRVWLCSAAEFVCKETCLARVFIESVNADCLFGLGLCLLSVLGAFDFELASQLLIVNVNTFANIL